MKNYFGSLDGIKKSDILASTYDLGFKGLHMILNDFENFQTALSDNIKEKINQKKVSSEVDVNKIINKFLFSFNSGIIIAFIKKISDSIASKNLLISIGKMEDKNNNPATKLVSIAVKLNFPGGLDKDMIIKIDKSFENNYLAKTILKFLVIEHLYKFVVKYSDKQSICENLGINLIKNRQILDKKRKKI